MVSRPHNSATRRYHPLCDEDQSATDSQSQTFRQVSTVTIIIIDCHNNNSHILIIQLFPYENRE